MLVALFDSELLCSPPSNRATKRLACVGFVWQADVGDEYDIVIITTTTATTTTFTTTTTTTTSSTRYARLRFARVPPVLFCAGSGRVVAFKFLKELKILRRILVLLLLLVI